MRIELTIAFKLWIFIASVFLIVDQIFFCSNAIEALIYGYQYDWSCISIFKSIVTYLLFNFLAQPSFILGIVNIFLSFAIMAEAFTTREKKYSTLFMVFDVFFQQTLIMGVSVALYFIVRFISFYASDYLLLRYPFGWHFLMIYYYWKNANQDPQSQTFLCSLKKKYFKWILTIITMVTTLHYLTIIIAALTATIQDKCCNKCVCKALNRLFFKIQKALCCSFLTQIDGFITMSKRSDPEGRQFELTEEKKVGSEAVFEKGMGVKVQGTGQNEKSLEINWK